MTRNPLMGTWEIAESEARQRLRKEAEFAPCDPRRILIVDDEQATRSWVHSLLKRAFPHCSFDVAEEGEAAAALFSRQHHAVVVMDVSMPKMDGEEAFRHMIDLCDERKWQAPGVVFCTGYNPSVSLRSIVAADPAHCLLRKPFRNKVLVEAVSKRLS